MELAKVSPDAWARRLVEVLAKWRCEIDLAPMRTEEDEEFMQATSAAFEAMKERYRREGLSQGLSQGIRAVEHLYERRIGRALTEVEQGVLRVRIERLGPDRLADVALDFEPDAIVQWLASPDAR
jgi:hypothetical protein